MMLPKPQILIIHEAGPATEYAKVLEKTGAKVSVVTSFEESNELLSFLHPDLIVLSANMPEGDGRLYCQQIKASMANPRPVLVLLHSSSDVNERINAFRYGADDVLPDPIDTSELAIRILVHMRRRQEDLSNPLTQMPGPNVIRRMLEQSLVSGKKWAAMSIDLNKIRVYNETYGDLAGDQLIKALGAILVDIADETDFVGHQEADDFVMITRLEGFEIKAKRICEQFDSISTRFYPREDLERGYLVSTGRNGIRRRVPLISVAIGVVTSLTKRFQSYIDVLTTARDARYLAKETFESSCIVTSEGQGVDTALGTNARVRKIDSEDRKILVVEPDGAMACLLQEILSLEGYLVEVTNSALDALEMAKLEQPDLILLESTLAASERQMDGWSLCKALKDDESLHKIWVVMATSHPDQLKALEAGADLYLPKPFDMPSLLKEVSLLLRSRLA